LNIIQKFGGRRPKGSAKRRKNVFFLAGVRILRGLSDTYHVRISTIFEITDVNRYADCDRRGREFCRPQNAFLMVGVIGWGDCAQRTAQTP